MFPLRTALPLLPTDLSIWNQMMFPSFPPPTAICHRAETKLEPILTTVGQHLQRTLMKPTEAELPSAVKVPGLLLIQIGVSGCRFVSIICIKEQGFEAGDEIDLPPSWRSLCREDISGNLAQTETTRRIECGEEIVLLPKTEKSINDDPEAQKATEAGFSCDRCGKVFTYSYYRDKHLKYTRCVDNGDRKFPCPICSRSFEKRDRLRIHILHVHENHRPHCCTVCGKAFSQSSSLNKHLRVHSGERPYACPFCPKAFTASSILRTHIRQHSGEKPFKCAHCGKAFASHAAHDSHVRRTHLELIKKS